MTQKHITVLKTEAVEALQINEESVVVDCTLGAGGHAEEIIKRLGSSGVYIGLDADPTAIESNQGLQKSESKVYLENLNFRDIDLAIEKHGVKPTAILADLGWRSEQFADPKRGFSFQSDGPLLMTYGDSKDYTFVAEEMVNDWAEESLADVIYGYGEERFSRRIAKAIVEAREQGEIKTTSQLATIIEDAVPTFYKRGRIHPATKTFQALRIAVNDELGVLKEFLDKGFTALEPGGYMAVITFHSLEDRMVKRSFATHKHDQTGELINKKPITPSPEEINSNPRARSAKMRVIRKKK